MLQAALAQRRLAAAAMPAMPRPHAVGGIADEFDARLPFTLTAGQVAVGETIAHELSCAYPMHRLLQGEVGSGKTVIAIRAMLQVVDAGGQAALLAPTEVLAQQHYRSITGMLGPLAQAGPARRGRARHRRGPAHRVGRGGRPAVGAVRRVHRRRRDRDRHPRPARGAGPVRRPRPGGHRRAAPVRRGAARRAARQGRGQPAARPGHDGHADPQDGGHDRLRRPGDLDADRAARGAFGHRHPRGARGGQAEVPGAGLGARPGGGRPRPAGLRGVPAHRRWPGF